jgi:hypothetical protein
LEAKLIDLACVACWLAQKSSKKLSRMVLMIA